MIRDFICSANIKVLLGRYFLTAGRVPDIRGSWRGNKMRVAEKEIAVKIARLPKSMYSVWECLGQLQPFRLPADLHIQIQRMQ